MEAAVFGSSVAPPLAIERYMAGCSGWLSDMQPESARSADMARIARMVGNYPRGQAAVVAYQQWLKSEQRAELGPWTVGVAVIPGRCASTGPGMTDLPYSRAAKIR